MTRTLSRLLTLLVSVAVLVALAVPALAHVTANPNAAPSGGYFKADFRVSHGCDGSPTTAVRIAIPDGVTSVKPQVVAGWEIETVIDDLAEPVEQHGQTITEGVREVIYRGGPLPDEHMQQFGLSMKMPEGEEGDVLWFPTIQECEDGETAWIAIPDSVDGWDDTEDPAPYITLTAATGGHGSDDDEAEGDEAAAAPASDETELATVTAGTSASGSSAMNVVALITGLTGLVLGCAAFITARRARV